MLPVMIGTLVAMLQGYSVLWVLYLGFPLALVVASFWTWLQLRNSICEILISEDKMAFRSVFDVAEPSRGQEWKLLLDMHPSSSGFTVTVGLEQFDLVSSDWPEWPELVEHVRSVYLSRFEDEMT